MGKWTIEFVGDKENQAWAVVDPEEEVRNEHWYGHREDAIFAAEVLNRHAPGSEYVTVCFSVKADSSVMSALSILEDGTVELDRESLRVLYEQSYIGNHVFSVAEVGCPHWAEQAGADPSLWRD